MHKVKAQARRHAWYQDEGAPTNYNPFGKHGISHTTSRSSVDTARDLEAARPSARRASSDRAWNSQDGRRQPTYRLSSRAASNKETLPPISSGSGDESPRRSLNFLPGHSHHRDEASREPDAAHAESTDTGNTLTSEKAADTLPDSASLQHASTAQPADDGPRRRKLGGLIGAFKHKEKGKEKDEAEGDDLDQVDTNGKAKPHFTFMSQIRATLLNSPINVLLIASPVGIAIANVKGIPAGAIFAVNFIAIIPLAALLSFATEEIALRTGETLGGLLNASFGNATELIVSIIALFHNEITITQTSLIGSMLSNLLLVLGMCFFFGGLTRVKQNFNQTVAQTASSLLALALAGLIVPTVFDVSTVNSTGETLNITHISRGVAILLLLVYGCYLFFQLKTHSEVYNAPSEKVPKRSMQKGDASKGIAQMGNIAGFMAGGADARDNVMPDEEDEPEEPKLHFYVALFTLCAATALIAVNSEFMVDVIPELGSTISQTFLGLILIPIVGNAAEHATAVTVACKDKMDLAIGVAVGSSMQIALLVLPLVVIIGWIAGKDEMNLDFDVYQIVMLFISILLVNYLIQDGESHWLEGVMLMIVYIAIATAAWFYPVNCDDREFCPSAQINGTSK